MKNQTVIKGLLMAIFTLVGTTITTTGFPTTITAWEILGITTAGTTLIYLGKNAWFPSISIFGTISVSDILSGVLVAVGTGVSSWAASAITSTPINWSNLFHLVETVSISYVLSKLGFGTKPATPTTPTT